MRRTRSKKKLAFSDHWLLWLIMVIAAASRFYALWDMPFTHDELSAILRTRYTTWHDLIELGVKGDNHPALVQLLMTGYIWFFGDDEFILKLPFVVAGVASVWLVFQLGSKLVRPRAGLWAAALMATLQFPITFSQLARPYAPGLFFTLLCAYGAVLLWQKKKFELPSIIIYSTGFLAAATTHYIAALQVAIIAGCFFFYLPKKIRIKFLLVHVILATFWLPNISIFFHHLDRGGIGNWLQSPDFTYIFHFLSYAVHYSWWVGGMIAVALVSSFIWPSANRQSKPNVGVLLIMLAFVPYAIVWAYSTFFNPLLHQSVLLFSFPFMVLLLSSLLQVRRAVFLPFILLLIAVNLTSLVTERNHYQIMQLSEYENSIDFSIACSDKYDSHDVLIITDLRSDFLSYYLQKKGVTTKFFKLDEMVEDDLRLNLESLNRPLICATTVIGSDPEATSVFRSLYPYLVAKEWYPLGEVELRSQRAADGEKDVCSEYVLEIDSTVTDEYPLGESTMVQTLESQFCADVDFFVNWRGSDSTEAVLTVAIAQDSEAMYWRGTKASHQLGKKQPHTVLHRVLANEFPESVRSDATLSFALWNPGKDSLYIESIGYRTYPENPLKYQLYD